MEEITGFLMKDCLSTPGLGLKYLNSLKTEDEPIYTYNDNYLKWFTRHIVFGGRISAFNQCYKSKISDDIIKIIPNALNFKGNVYDIIEAYMKYEHKYLKTIKEEYEGKFHSFRGKDDGELINYINKTLGELLVTVITAIKFGWFTMGLWCC